MCDQQRLRPACAYAQSDQSLCSSLEYSMSDKLLTEHLLEVLSLKGGCTGSHESALVKMPHCWKSHVTAQLFLLMVSSSVIFQLRCMVAEYVQLHLLVTVVGTKHIALRWVAQRWCTYESPLRKPRVLSPPCYIRSWTGNRPSSRDNCCFFS